MPLYFPTESCASASGTLVGWWAAAEGGEASCCVAGIIPDTAASLGCVRDALSSLQPPRRPRRSPPRRAPSALSCCPCSVPLVVVGRWRGGVSSLAALPGLQRERQEGAFSKRSRGAGGGGGSGDTTSLPDSADELAAARGTIASEKSIAAACRSPLIKPGDRFRTTRRAAAPSAPSASASSSDAPLYVKLVGCGAGQRPHEGRHYRRVLKGGAKEGAGGAGAAGAAAAGGAQASSFPAVPNNRHEGLDVAGVPVGTDTGVAPPSIRGRIVPCIVAAAGGGGSEHGDGTAGSKGQVAGAAVERISFTDPGWD